jgi:phosphonate transport system substrate-binding protein
LYIRARKEGYRVVVKVAGEPFTGIVVVRRDSPIRHLGRHRLPKGLKIGFPDPNAYAATVMVRQYMRSLGEPVAPNFKVRYFSSQDSALMAVYYGLVDMAGSWFPSLRSMPARVRRGLRVVAETPPQPQMPIAVRDDMPAADAAGIRHLLTHLTDTADGRAILAHLGFTQGFVAASNREYDGVKP